MVLNAQLLKLCVDDKSSTQEFLLRMPSLSISQLPTPLNNKCQCLNFLTLNDRTLYQMPGLESLEIKLKHRPSSF